MSDPIRAFAPVVEVVSTRQNHLVDPHLHVWGWEVPVYLWLGGAAAGLMILSAVLPGGRGEGGDAPRGLRWLPFAAPALIALGMGSLFLDLELKWHVYRFYLAFRPSSPMSWGAWILLAIYPATLLLGAAGLTEAELRRAGPLAGLLRALGEAGRRHLRGLRVANVLLGVGLGAYTGVLLGTLGARALWSSALLGPLFLASGLSTGAALAMLLPLGEAAHGRLRRWDIGALATELALLLLYLVGLSTGGEAGREAATLLLDGPYTPVFWGLVVVAGLAVPLVIELAEDRGRAWAGAWAPALVLAGGLALRWVLVAAGQA